MPSVRSTLGTAWNLAFPQRSRQSAPVDSGAITISNSTITPGTYNPHRWEELGPGAQYLLAEMRKMYWIGVSQEMERILLTLKRWQEPGFAEVELDEEREGNDPWIHGYDTFVDSINEKGREAAERYKARRAGWRRGHNTNYKVALEEYSHDLQLSKSAAILRKAILMNLDTGTFLSGPKLERRARMLLRSAGFLDIDKMIEYRPPEKYINFWRRPAAAQLTVVYPNDSILPCFVPVRCVECERTIRGCTYEKRTSDVRVRICEDCYRSKHYADDVYVKHFKHSVLEEIDGSTASRMCRCIPVPHYDGHGQLRDIFPLDERDDHRGSKPDYRKDDTSIRCPLLNLGHLAAEVKYDSLFDEHDYHLSLSDQKRQDDEKLRKTIADVNRRQKPLRQATKQSLVDSTMLPESGSTGTLEEDQADDDIPFFLRKFTNKYPFGNVHMALRVGPLVIENGVQHSHGGAVITIRDPPHLQILRDPAPEALYRLAVTDDKDRNIRRQYQPLRPPKRYKAVMKQIVGYPFAGLADTKMEEVIVQALVNESQKAFDPSPKNEAKLLRKSVNCIVQLLHDLIEPRVEIYLASIASRLLDPQTNLRWSFKSNNCQNFCDALLDYSLFGSLLPRSSDEGSQLGSLYLFSFFTRPESYTRDPVGSKYDVPSGLTEEYLLKFRYGRHEESDIYDSLQEYWHDWGSFRGPIYRNQTLFPWDCTEAFRRYPGKCNDCTISKHVWAFPFDSWSIIALHFTKDRYQYPSGTNRLLSDQAWMQNRLALLVAQESLVVVAAAMARTRAFAEATDWLFRHKDPRIDRLKLGGIHRAQPFSHCFDRGKYHHYFIAEWAHMRRERQIQLYEALRDGRVRMADVPGTYTALDSDMDGGCGGCSAACAGGCGVSCGGDCGSGDCAVACGGDDGGGGDGGDGCIGCASD